MQLYFISAKTDFVIEELKFINIHVIKDIKLKEVLFLHVLLKRCVVYFQFLAAC
jgi:hypothetical protein